MGPLDGTDVRARNADTSTYPQAASGAPRHRMFAIEYHNPMIGSFWDWN
jgi:hypothetical protein